MPRRSSNAARRLAGSLPLALALLIAAIYGLHGQSRVAQLIDAAKAQVSAHHPDSAAALLRIALDSATQATPQERENALVWQGIAAFLRGDEALSRSAFRRAIELDSALDVAGLDRLSPDLAEIFRLEKRAAFNRGVVYLAGHVEEPPRRLSGPPRLRRAGTKRPHGEMAALQTVDELDEQPTLVSHPAIRYPPEMAALRVGGTVVVEASVSATGHVEPTSVSVVASPNHAFDEEARRVVRGSVYRPGRIRGRPVHAVIRQAITFVTY